MTTNATQAHHPLSIALMAIRPKTLPAAIAPVLIGTALAAAEARAHLLVASIALLAALLIQIGTNLANDYYDFIKGADAERIGPTRVTQAGLVSPRSIKAAWLVTFALAAALGAILIARGGWPIFWIGILSIASGILYTGGPFPLGYNGLGDIFVLVFFGPVAVGGTYYLQTLSLQPNVLLLSLPPGLIATALLAVNNLRDIDTDRKVGKMTLAARFGPRFARAQILLCLSLALLIPPALYAFTRTHPFSLATLLLAPLLIPILRRVFSHTDGPSLNLALAHTGRLLVLYGILFSSSWLIP